MSDSERFSGRRAGKSPAERSNFAQACTLLSQFLKEKRNLSVGVSGNTETKEKPETFTKNFLTNIENPASVSTQNGVVAPSTVKPSDFVQKLVGFGAQDSNKADPRKIAKRESSEMTIFYSGKVLVFNDLPDEKANEIIALARKGSSNISVSVSVSEPIVNAIEIIDLSKSVSPEPPLLPLPVKKAKPEIDINVNVNVNGDESKDDHSNNNNNNNKLKTMPQRPSQPANGSDLPIARRNSLHRFLEKRKDRVAAKAPYQVPNGAAEAVRRMAPPKPEEGSSKDGECSDQQLELKL